MYSLSSIKDKIHLFKNSTLWYLSTSDTEVAKEIEAKLPLSVKELNTAVSYDIITKSSILYNIKQKISQNEYQKEIQGLKGEGSSNTLTVSPNKMSWRKKSDNETNVVNPIFNNKGNGNNFQRGRFFSNYNETKDNKEKKEYTKLTVIGVNDKDKDKDKYKQNLITYSLADKGNFELNNNPIVLNPNDSKKKIYTHKDLLTFYFNNFKDIRPKLNIDDKNEVYDIIISSKQNELLSIETSKKRLRAFTQVIDHNEIPVKFDYSGKII